jgi:class 3 adenylate cyclase
MAHDRPARVERRLSAILAADVSGYSRLMHSDEEATHAKLTTLLTDAVVPAIAEHVGRIVKNTGDGFLAEFPSAVQAVRAAVQFQTRITELTIAEAEEPRFARQTCNFTSQAFGRCARHQRCHPVLEVA